jgi:hypothetical protein
VAKRSRDLGDDQEERRFYLKRRPVTELFSVIEVRVASFLGASILDVQNQILWSPNLFQALIGKACTALWQVLSGQVLKDDA